MDRVIDEIVLVAPNDYQWHFMLGTMHARNIPSAYSWAGFELFKRVTTWIEGLHYIASSNSDIRILLNTDYAFNQYLVWEQIYDILLFNDIIRNGVFDQDLEVQMLIFSEITYNYNLNQIIGISQGIPSTMKSINGGAFTPQGASALININNNLTELEDRLEIWHTRHAFIQRINAYESIRRAVSNC